MQRLVSPDYNGPERRAGSLEGSQVRPNPLHPQSDGDIRVDEEMNYRDRQSLFPGQDSEQTKTMCRCMKPTSRVFPGLMLVESYPCRLQKEIDKQVDEHCEDEGAKHHELSLTR